MYNDEPGIESNQCLKTVSFLAATAVISFFKIKYFFVLLYYLGRAIYIVWRTPLVSLCIYVVYSSAGYRDSA